MSSATLTTSVRGGAGLPARVAPLGVSFGTLRSTSSRTEVGNLAKSDDILTLMAVHAHPDDEASSTGGILAKYSAEGARTVVVTCTNGEMGDGPMESNRE